MTDATFNSQAQPFPSTDSTQPSTHKKIIGQCPVCAQAFTSQAELRSHMEDPPNHSPADNLDAVSFGELSSDDEEGFEHWGEPPSKQSRTDGYSKLDTEDFGMPDMPNVPSDNVEFAEDYNDSPPFEDFFPSAAQFNAEQGSIHTIHDEDEQPSAEHKSFENSAHKSSSTKQREARGVLYCGTCDKYFGNEKTFKRHFIFGIKHGEEGRDMRDLYHQLWLRTWLDEGKKDRSEGNVMEL